MLNADVFRAINEKPSVKLNIKKKKLEVVPRKKNKVTVTGTPEERREKAKVLVIGALKASESLCVSELANLTGLTKSCVRNVIKPLKISGAITEEKRKAGGKAKDIHFYSLEKFYAS